MENNWEQVKDIFQAALDRPVLEREKFLAEACRGNQSLSEEVRGLLDSFEENDSFFEREAIGEVADLIVGDDSRLKPEAKVGRYTIKHQLGAGGMGEVFLAEDTELERLVALKILSPIFAGDKDRVRRFVREAKSVSALNHPNILTIYEIGQHDGLHFIATEYIKGETLRSRQKNNALRLREILDIFIQAATALSAAHEAKIIHRDIKPENIMIREDGLVKVLDFGLAKLVGEKQSMLDQTKMFSTQLTTTPGLIMGTVAYMSPEQTRGQEIDARSDIWSLGVCLYEIIAGCKPFAGDTMSDTIASIIKSEPLPLRADTPKKLVGIIKKTLQKNPADRYRNIGELLNELKFLHQNLDSAAETEIFSNKETFGGGEDKLFIGDFSVVQATNENHFDTVSSSVVEKIPAHGFNWKMPAIAAGAFSIVVAFAVYYLPFTANQNSTFEKMRFSKLTSSGNVAGYQIAVSPDGKQTVFVLEEGGKQSLRLKPISGSADIQLISPEKIQYDGLTFSKDGQYVYYTAMQEDKSVALYRVSIGGEIQKLIENVIRPVSFSPDGKRMSFIQESVHLMTANADGSDLKRLATAKDGKKWNFTAWSPDDKTIVCSTVSTADANTYLVEISIENGTETLLNSPPWMRIVGIEWLSDKSGLIISGRDLETKLSQIWMIGYPNGKVSRITNDLNNYFGVGLIADGRSIASIKHERKSGIWLASESKSEPVRQATFESEKDEGLSGVALTSDGRIVYTIAIGGTQDLWIANSDGTDKRQLTKDVRSNNSPTVSSDNRYIAFTSDRLGSPDLWRIDSDGNNPKQLTNKPGISSFPVFSPDDKWIVYQFGDAGKSTIWKISVDGGEPMQLTDFHCSKPTISPDGNSFACYYGNPVTNEQNKIAIVPFSGGKPVKMLEIPALVRSAMVRWTADGKGLIYIDKDGQSDNLWKQPLDNQPPELLTNFKSEKIYRFDALNSKLAVASGLEISDVIMINDFR